MELVKIQLKNLNVAMEDMALDLPLDWKVSQLRSIISISHK